MARLIATITIHLESERDESTLDEVISELVWAGVATPLVNDGGADEVSHVHVDTAPEVEAR